MDYVEFFNTLRRVETTIEFIKSNKNLTDIVEKITFIQRMLQHFGTLDELIKRFQEIESYVYVCKDFMTIDEAAKYLGISKGTLYHMTAQHVIPYSKPNGRVIYISREDLNNYILSDRHPSTSEINAMSLKKARELKEERKNKIRNNGI